MKNFSLTSAALTLSVTLLVPCLPIHAEENADKDIGGIHGGGGQVVVTQKPDGTKTAEVLDLWESRVDFHRPVPDQGDDIETIIDSAWERLKHVVHAKTQYWVATNRLSYRTELPPWVKDEAKAIATGRDSRINPIEEGKLPLTKDAYEEVQPEEGSLEQVVYYKDISQRGQIKVNMRLKRSMNATHLAALGLHEALYKFMRMFGETNSIRVRRAVGYVMSGGTFSPLDGYLNQPHITCTSTETMDGEPLTKMYILKSREFKFWTIVAERVDGREMMGFTERYSGFGNSSDDINAVFKDLRRDWATVWNEQHGPVDFDTVLRFEGGPSGPTLQLLHLAGRPYSEKKFRLKCRLEK